MKFFIESIAFVIVCIGILVLAGILAGLTLYLIGEKDAGFFWSGVVFMAVIGGLSQIGNEIRKL